MAKRTQKGNGCTQKRNVGKMSTSDGKKPTSVTKRRYSDATTDETYRADVAKCIHISTSVDVSPHSNSPVSPDGCNCSGIPNGSPDRHVGATCLTHRQVAVESGQPGPEDGPLPPLVPITGPDACPACRGRGTSDPVADFLGDDPATMRVCTMSFCQLCGGTGRDPNWRADCQLGAR